MAGSNKCPFYTDIKKIQLFFLPILLFNLFAASYYALKSDLLFHTDIARDFLLFAEVQEKKIVLIGGRSSAAGIFHGPLWNYLNFPVFWISKGNPIIQEYFWIGLIIFFMFYSFKITKNIFNTQTSIIYTILMSSFLIPWAKEFSHPEGAILIMPIFFFTFYKYITQKDLKYLAAHIFVAGLLIQMEIAAGAPFFVLSALYIIWAQYKCKKLNHTLAFFIILIPLSTYILFDLKHNFLELNSLIKYISPHSSDNHVGFLKIFMNRITYMFTAGMPLVPAFKKINIVISLVFLFLIFKIIKGKEKNHQIYLIFLYFFLGYFSISLTVKYYLLTQDFLPFIPVVVMFFSSLIMSKYKIFIPIVIIIILLNEFSAAKYIITSNKLIGNNLNSWKELQKIENDIFKDNQGEFGYFIYSPDKLSYQAKYAMLYGSMNHKNIKANYFQKTPTTYIISEPPATFDPFAKYWTSDWWIKNSIRIDKKPEEIINYSNGYIVEKFYLSPSEIAIPWDQQEDTGIHFR